MEIRYRPSRPSPASLLSALALLAPPLCAQEVWIVDEGGGGDFEALQPAIEAASSGDTILVRDAPYTELVSICKGVQVIDEDPDDTWVSLLVRDLPAGQVLRISTSDGWRLRLEDNAGHIVIEGMVSHDDTHSVTACADVLFVDCVLFGYSYSESCPVFQDGGTGLDVRASVVSLYSCMLVGGSGSEGVCFWVCDYAGGSGGPGLRATDGSSVFATLCSFQGGQGGNGCEWPKAPDGPPTDVDPDSELILADHPQLVLDVPPSLGEGEQLDLEVTGTPGGFAVLLASDDLWYPDFGFPRAGVLHLQPPLQLVPLGVVPDGGQLSVALDAPLLPPGFEAATRWLQVYQRPRFEVLQHTAAGRHLSDPAPLTILAAGL